MKKARDMNQALLAKLAWTVLACPGVVWHEVLRAKYGVADVDGAYFRGKQNSTLIWRGVVCVWGGGCQLLRRGLRKEVTNGRCMQFWKDVWLEEDSLWERSLTPVAEDYVVKSMTCGSMELGGDGNCYTNTSQIQACLS